MNDITMEKKGGETAQEMDSQSVDHGAVERLQTYQFSPEAERRLVRKIDFMILPIMVFAYLLAFLDKQTLSYSALMGITEDLHLVGTQYSWSSGIFYFGYLFFSYPASLLMVKFPLGKYLAVNFMLWAIVLACHAATKNFATFMVTRFFLGCTEASLSPGFTLLTSLWYRRSEQPLRAGIWFCGNSLSSVFGNLIAAGIIHINSKLASWQEERKIAVERLKDNQAGFKSNEIDRVQILEAFKDVQTWLLAILIFAANIVNGGFTTFNGLILEGFGFDLFDTLLLGLPGGVIVCIFVFLSGYVPSRVKGSRCIVMVVMYLISILGSSLVYAGKNTASRYGGLLLMGVYSASMPVSMAIISSNVGGFTKRATVSAIYFIMYCAGNIVGPQLFFARQAPKYQSGFLAIIICLVACVAISLIMLFYLRWENSRRDKQGVSGDSAANRTESKPVEQGELLDITDRQNEKFRYAY
ncbi:hypothetical protein N7504_008620 [Penicillium tannophilum]|nr:hypothetical protein N7504_008620 [Penicillium tannophilum]